MRKLINIAMIVVCAIFICGPAALCVAEQLFQLQLPDWLTVAEAEEIEGNKKEPDIFKDLNFEGIVSGKLTQTAETCIDNYIPAKGRAMLANAALQRSLIRVANTAFSWDCYPTFFDSKRIYIPSMEALSFVPEAQTESKESDLRSFADSVVDLAKRYPDNKFVICIAPAYETPAVNPAYELSSNAFTSSIAYDIVSQTCNAQNNVFTCMPRYDNLDQYYEDYSKTDHHWNRKGAIAAYNNIAATIGKEPFPQTTYHSESRPWIKASNARTGLYAIVENTPVPDFDFSNLTIKGKDQGSKVQTITNPSGEGLCLLIGDSFRDTIKKTIAEGYKKTTVSCRLHGNTDRSEIDSNSRFENDFDLQPGEDVYLLSSESDFRRLIQRCPDYFKL